MRLGRLCLVLGFLALAGCSEGQFRLGGGNEPDGPAGGEGAQGGEGAAGGASGTGGAGSTGAGAGPGGVAGEAGVGGTGAEDAGEPEGPTLELTQVIAEAPWMGGQLTMGMAVDSRGRLFISGGELVYVLEGSSLNAYLTREDVASLGDPGVHGFGDLDVAIDDAVYVTTSTGILHSRAPHDARLWRETPPPSLGVFKLGVRAVDEVAFLERTGFQVASSAGERLVFEGRIKGASACATEDLAVAESGVFLYQPGCLASQLLRGDLRGESLFVVSSTDWEGATRCLTRDPSGGFYLVAEDVNHEFGLYHVTEDASGSAGLTPVRVTPSLSEARRTQYLPLAFLFCSIAAGRDGTIYLQTYNQLWKLTPP